MSDDKRNQRPKTRFEPVKRTPPEPPRSATPPAAAAPPPPAAAPPPVLRALAPGAAPRATGLARDARGYIVGPQGLVAVQGVRRLAAFFAAFSQVADLARGVALEAHADGLFLVSLTPPTPDEAPSQHYDTVQGALVAARLSAGRARLFVGDGRIMVPYADPAAPHGYDADGVPPATGRVLLHPGAAALHLAERPTALLATLLPMPLLPAPHPAPTTLSLLTDRRLVALIASYVQRHGLAYGVRLLTWHQGTHTAEAALFDIVTAGEARPVPGFVSDFLRRLPHTTLLSDALEPADLEHEPARRILLPHGRRTPLHLPHVQDLLPAHSLLIIAEAPWGAALIATPAPRTSMQRLTEAIFSAPATATLSTQPAERLQLRLELRRDGVARGPIHGLLLDAAALTRLQRLVCRLPAPLFAHARIALGDGVALVLAADDGELTGLPLGQPFARAEPPTLLLPRGVRLLPALPQDLLIPALNLLPATLTVLTPTSRYDVALSAFQPLASLLTFGPSAQRGAISVRPSALPPLDLRDLEGMPPPPPSPPPPTERPTPVPEPEKRSLLGRLLGIQPAAPTASGDFATEVRRRAAELEQHGDYELAAAFYSYLHDEVRAAACYQHLTQEKPA